ncbi:hypothetical protein Pcinc_005191 [Petrolisthes cinctipes]|uniref:Uncharacterized protein n=1 Tax=Petrolisthes cinctipes TaxID=88211 RepID=A0AAE1GE41_PETCI|nr:hypothetical protein Pcinc_005191 [Petrolisthes cinctipes]
MQKIVRRKPRKVVRKIRNSKKRRKRKHMEEKEIVSNDASKQKEASNTEEVKQLVDKSNAEEETAENAEKETTENAEEESTENAEEETTETTEEEEKEENEKKRKKMWTSIERWRRKIGRKLNMRWV